MKKMALMAAVAALMGAGVAHAQSTQTPDQHAQRQHAEDGRGPGRRGGAGGDQMLLRGITLSDAQKAKLEELHKAERSKAQANGEQRPNFEAIRDARQKGDTVTANRLMQEQRARMEARRNEQVGALRGILTKDQQKQLDANLAEMKQHEGQFGRGGRQGGERQGAQRPDAGR